MPGRVSAPITGAQRRILMPDKLLFTPGPLTTSDSVKRTMLHDLGSRDEAFIAAVRGVRQKLLALTGLSQEKGYEAVLMQGSGTFGIESVVGSTVPRGGKLLVIINGAYGRRIAQMAEILGIDIVKLEVEEYRCPEMEPLERMLEEDPAITNVFVVHCETTTGILNPLEAIGKRVRAAGKTFCVDAMSSFGAIPVDLEACNIDFLVSSANKCIEGVPGFSFILARRESLLATDGMARSLSFDLLAQWKGLESNGQFRFTPPTHAILAFHQALVELEEEGGVAGRGRRYAANNAALLEGMETLGFSSYLDRELQSYIITSFYYPDHPAFDFESFYSRLSDQGFVIYPGKLSQADCFRIGNIGQIFLEDIERLIAAVGDVLEEIGVSESRVMGHKA